MNEREIIERAINIQDADQRRAFLDEVCGADAALRKRIDELLASYNTTNGFPTVPAVERVRPADVGGHHATLELSPASGATHVEPADNDGDHDDDAPGAANLSFLQPSSKPGSIGRLGHYEILQMLGQGAFGIVFKAFDEKLHRHVAVKAMSPELASTSPPRKRFLREARSVAALKHENIIQIYSVEEQPLPYLAMEFVDGQTLQQKLDAAGPFDPLEVLHLGRQMAAGLAAAHEKGLIHRDIKPGNILLEAGAEQKVKITDFGLARAADDATMTRTGTIAGTPMYMAPEQALGQTLDHRADLFSLGSVLYQMTCGRPPFRGSSVLAVLKRVADEEPRPIWDILPEAPEWLCTIIAKLHAKNPDERYQTAREVADLLARCQSELQLNGRVTCVAAPKPVAMASVPVQSDAKSPAVEHSAAAPASRRPLALFVAAALVLVVVGLAVTELTGVTRFFGRSVDDPSPTVASGSPDRKSSDSNESSATVPDSKASSTTSARRDGLPADAPPPAIAPFDAAQAKLHQEAWAKHLGVPVEFTNSIGMKFRLIPPGEFMMGMTKEEAEAVAALNPNDELWKTMALSSAPAHKVRLTQAYYLGTYEVTQEQYEKVAGVNPSHFSAQGEGKELVKDEDPRQHPVEMISFIDAAEFCIKLCKQGRLKPVYFSANNVITLLPGDGYRLPTEAEWEWACRAGTNTAWFHGEQESTLGTVAWFEGNSGGRTHAVGQLKANPFGLYDVHGNVWEWCQDWHDAQAYSQRGPGPTEDPQGPEAGSARVMRGGGWCHSDSAGCRSACRKAHAVDFRFHNLGFRVLVGVDAVRQALKGEELAKSPAPSPAADPDREFAEWLLSEPGKGSVSLVGRETPVDRREQLPAEPFRVQSFEILAAESFSDADVARLRGLSELHSITFNGPQPGFTDRGLEQLAAHSASTLRILHVYDPVGVSDAGAEHLNKLVGLQTLTLHSEKFTNAGLSRLVLAELTSLSLSTKASPLGLRDGKTRLPKLSSVYFAGVPVGADELSILAQWNLRGVFLDKVGLRDADLEPLLAYAKSLEFLGLKECPEVTDQGVRRFAEFPHLKVAQVSGPGITDASCAVLAALPELQGVWIRSSRITDAGVVSLLRLPQLSVLDLSDNLELTDAVLESVTKRPELKSLRVVGCAKLTEPALRKLQATLPDCRIESNFPALSPPASPGEPLNPAPPIDFAAERKAAEWGLGLGGGVELVTELGQPVGLVDGKLPDVPFAVSKINLLGKTAVTDDSLQVLQGCARLRSLNLEGTSIDGKGLPYLSGHKTLAELHLGITKVNDAGMAHLAGMTQLRRLNLWFSNEVTDAGVAQLQSLSSLEFLIVPSKITDAGLAPLSQLRGLRELWFVCEGVTDVGVAQMIKQNPNLEFLRISHHQRTLAPLAGMERLRVIQICGPQLSPEGLQILQSLPRLESLQLESGMTAEQIARLGDLPQLRQIEIYYFHGDDIPYFGDAAFMKLARLPRLEMIHVHGTIPSPTDAVLESWATIPSLKYVLFGFDEPKRQYTPAGIAKFRKLRPDVHLSIDGQDDPPSPAIPYAVIAKLDETDPLPKWDLPAGSPPPVVAPCSPDQASALQRQWAEHLKRPVVEEFAARKELALKFALVPPGEFRKIFTRPRDPVIEPDMPVRRFRITRPYALSTAEITWDQFRQFVEATGYKTEAEASGLGGKNRQWQNDPQITWRNPGWNPDPHEPVVQITSRDAQAFCAWLSQTGQATYRLPTEAEWLHACRAGSVHPHVVPTADELADHAWTKEFVDPDPSTNPLHPVGQKKPNPFGLHDMLGNVWERTDDSLTSEAVSAYLPTNNPRGGTTGGQLVGADYASVRGHCHPDFVWSSHREPTANVGFRVLQQLDGEPLPGPLDRPFVLRVGQPMSVHANVPRPETIPGLRSWSIELQGTESIIQTIAVNSASDLIATGGPSGKINLWDGSGKHVRTLLGHDGQISSLDFSPDGTWLASCDMVPSNRNGLGSTLRIWNVDDAATPKVVPVLLWNSQAAFSPDGKRLAVSAAADSFLVIDLETGRSRTPSSVGRPASLTWSPDGAQLACLHADQRLRVWDAATLAVVREAEAPMTGGIAWSPDGKWLAMRDAEGRVAIRDARTLAVTNTFGSHVVSEFRAVTWFPDSRRLAVAREGAPAGVFDATTGEMVVSFDAGPNSVYAIALRANGAEAVLKFFDRWRRCDSTTGKTLTEGKPNVADARGNLSLDGRELFATVGDQVWIHDAATGQRRRGFKIAGAGEWHAPQPSPDGTVLAVGTWWEGVPAQLLDAGTGDKRFELPHGTSPVANLAWAPDGRRLATGAHDGVVRLWNAADGKLERELAGHAGPPRSLAWNRDGSRLATSGDDKSVRIWNPRDGRLLARFDRFPEPILYTGSDGLAWDDHDRLWIRLSANVVPLNVNTGTFGSMEFFSNGGNAVQFLKTSPDGRRMLARDNYQWTILRGRDAGDRRLLGQWLGEAAQWHPDNRRFLGWQPWFGTVGYDVDANRRLGKLFPSITGDHWLCVGPTGHYRGSPGVEEQIVYVAMHDDGSQRTYTPAEFAAKFGWKNDPEKATLLQLSP